MAAFSHAKKIATAAVIGLSLPVVAHWEGLRTDAYLDPIGIPTVCYGHTETAQLGQSYTEDECRQMLSEEIMEYVDAVERNLTREVPVETKAALVSFTYNLGEPALKRSTALRKINAGDIEGGCNALMMWAYAGGKKLQGLVNRRADERDLCLQGLE